MPRGNPNWKKKEEEPKEQEEIKKTEEKIDNMCYFFSYPKKFQVHYKDEERYHNGDVKQMATVIQFADNIWFTDKPDEIKCIRKCGSFGTAVKECKNTKEVEELRRARTLQRMGKLNGVLADDNLTVEEAPIVAVMGAGS